MSGGAITVDWAGVMVAAGALVVTGLTMVGALIRGTWMIGRELTAIRTEIADSIQRLDRRVYRLEISTGQVAP